MVDDQNDKHERRRDNRAPIELKVEYKRVNTFFADYTRNISRGGTFIKTDNPLQVGTEFIFRLHVPALEEPLELKGMVQWVVPTDVDVGDDVPGMGIRFIYEHEEHRKKVQKRVEDLMIESFGFDIYKKLMQGST